MAREVRGEAAGAARARGEALLRGGGDGGDGAGGVVRVAVRRGGGGETCWAFVYVYIYRQVCFLVKKSNAAIRFMKNVVKYMVL